MSESKEKRRLGVFGYLILVLNNIAALALLLAALSQFIPPEKMKLFPFLGLGYIYLVFINLAFIVFWLISRRKQFLLSLACILLSWNNFGREFQFSSSSLPENTPSIKVMSFNVKNFNHQGYTNNKYVLDSIIQLVNEQEADILCLQDFVSTRKLMFNPIKRIKKEGNFPRHYMEHYASSHSNNALIIFSKYPVINHDFIKIAGVSRDIGIYADLLIGEDTIRVYNLHLQSNHITGEKVIPESISELNSMDEQSKLKENTKRVMRTMNSAYKKRAQQSRTIGIHIKKCSYPVILCGDFNDTPNSFAYRKIKGKLNDAFIKSGKSFGSTYLFNNKRIRIDYIFASPDFDIYNYQVLRKGLSDHQSICTDLVLEKE